MKLEKLVISANGSLAKKMLRDFRVRDALKLIGEASSVIGGTKFNPTAVVADIN